MYLWSNPDLPHWQRLLLGIVYLPILFWWWLCGKPIYLGNTTTVAVDWAKPGSKDYSVEVTMFDNVIVDERIIPPSH